MVDEWVSLREFARRKGVQVSAVQSALSNGRIVRRDDDKKIHWPTQSKAWDDFRDPSKVRSNGKQDKPKFQVVEHEVIDLVAEEEDDDGDIDEEGGSSGRGYLEAKARREIAMAGLKEIELEEAKGRLIKASVAKSAMTQFAIDVRDGIMTIQDRVSSELAAELAGKQGQLDLETIKDVVQRIWKRESRKVLEAIANAGDLAR